MKSFTSSLRELGILTVALTLALVANFAYGQWTDAPASPPSNNAAAPVNVSANNQTKSGMLTAPIFRAADQMRSDLYCDYDGSECLSFADILNGLNQSGGNNGNATLDLVFGQHSSSQCTALGGTVETEGGNKFCRFSSTDSCPSGWAQYQNWSTTVSAQSPFFPSQACGRCTTSQHSWSNTARESCTYYTDNGDGCNTNAGQGTKLATLTELGCY